jgi:endoglucanase
MLVLPTMHTGSEQPYLDALNHTIDELDDPNLIATVHFYGFWPFSVNVAGYTRFDDEVRQDIIDTFDRVHNAFVTRGIPVVIGEYGLLGFDQHVGTIQQGEKLKFFEFVNHYAQQTQLTTQLWDNGQHFNRTAMHWRDQEFFDMLAASWAGRSGTASADQVYVEVAGQITDQTLTLNHHGTTFQGLRHGGTALVEGQDYTVAGDQLTISAGTTVRFVNLDGEHSVTPRNANQPGVWQDRFMSPGQSFEHTFTVAGQTYDYYCIPHPMMTGVVIVED